MFIKIVFGKKKTDITSDELSQKLLAAVKANSKMTIQDFLDKYHPQQKQTVEAEKKQPLVIETKQTHIVHYHESSSIVENWYKTNSVNLLLYIGAFLIVSSAAIFVGFQWETIAGIVKASLLTLLALIFFSCGVWFYSLPKIKNAGATFIMIGAVLIPVLGSAWHTFVLKNIGFSSGEAWLMTSIIAISVYIFLAMRYRNVFYAYASTIATISLFLSLVSTWNLNDNFYILAAIIANFVLLFTHISLKNTGQPITIIFSTPFKLSSEVMMPLTLVYGFFIALWEGKLYSLEGVLSIFLATVFYFVSYLFTKRSWELILGEIFIPFTIILFVGWQSFSETVLYYLLNFCALGYALAANAFYVRNQKQEMNSNLVFALGLSLIVLLFSWNSVPPIRSVLFTIITIAIALFTAYLKKKPSLLLITTILIALLVYNIQTKLLMLPEQYLTISFGSLGALAYILCLHYKSIKALLNLCCISTLIYFFLSLSFSITHEWYLFSVLLTIAYIWLNATMQFNIANMLYGAVSFSVLALIVLLETLHLQGHYYPLVINCYAYCLYAIGLQMLPDYKQKLIRSSLLLSLVPFVYGLGLGNSYDANADLVESYALFSAYATTIFYGFHTALQKTKHFGYITSALGMMTIIWQLSYWGVTDSLMYSALLGIYFLVLGYTRRLVHDYSRQDNLNVIGLFFLLLPPIILSFDVEPTKYSVFLGISGILLTGLGISLSYKIYKYGGIIGIIFAVLPQTYNYILELPRWIVVGMIGIIFLTVAIFLLLQRGEHHDNK